MPIPDAAAAAEPAVGNATDGLRFLQPGANCDAIVIADRAAVLIDNAAYYTAVHRAIRAARHTIFLIGWTFDPRTRLLPGESPDAMAPQPGTVGNDDPEAGTPDAIGALLDRQARRHPALAVRILIWDTALPIALPRSLFPHRARLWFRHSPCRFALDRAPPGACHHEKLLVIDDHIAFCSGGDFSPNRWDSPAHRDDEPRRTMPDGVQARPRHEMTVMVEGAAAAALGEIARARWNHGAAQRGRAHRRSPATPPTARPAGTADGGSRDTGAAVATSAAPAGAATASDGTVAGFVRAATGIVRSRGTSRGRTAVGDGIALHERTFTLARDYLYLENQYVTCLRLAATLVERLREPDGPQIVLVNTRESPGFADHHLMDRMRAPLLHLLRHNDRFGRLRVIGPRTDRGRALIVHSKVTIADDRLLRIGSMNLNNRSFGVDTECDIAIEARDEGDVDTREAIRDVRNRLIAHLAGGDPARFGADVARFGLIGAVDRLDPGQKWLTPLHPRPLTALTRLVAGFEIGDPHSMSDMLQPWRRWRRRRAILRRLAQGDPRADNGTGTGT